MLKIFTRIQKYSNNSGKPFNFRSRSHLTEMLWKDRYAKGKFGSPTSTSTSTTTNSNQHQNTQKLVETISKTPRKMSDSFCEVIMPFRTDLDLREDYVNQFKGIRFGKVLEDLDALAASISHKHCSMDIHKDLPLMIVTASVDRIDLLHPLRADYDLKLCGHVTHVGRSSMEVTIRVESFGDPHSKDPIDESGFPLTSQSNPKWTPICLCKFTMVARDFTSNKSAAVSPLVADTPQEQSVIDMGERRKEEKLEIAKRDLRKLPPGPEERILIHNLWLEAQKYEDRQGKLIENTTDNISFPSETIQQKVQLMHPQERNIHSSIFGGYLMREAFELAYTTAMLYIGGRPWTVALDDIAFSKPVPIGSILFLTSQVVFAEGYPHSTFQVKVSAEVSTDTKNRQLTNIFYITFAAVGPNDEETVRVNKLLPLSYTESMEYLLGQRRKQHGINYKNAQLKEFLQFKLRDN